MPIVDRTIHCLAALPQTRSKSVRSFLTDKCKKGELSTLSFFLALGAIRSARDPAPWGARVLSTGFVKALKMKAQKFI